jgi:CHAT domain-containing protein
MAALHDGRQFLIEKYPLATALGLNLTAGDRPAPPTRPALILGLTEELPAVAAETATVEKIVGGNRFLDRDFTSANFRQRLKQRDYAIVHIATHGKFNPDIDSSFLQAFDSRIQLTEFEDILRLRKPAIELLVLSACQTAVGDDRSTLGLAGVALRTGVKSVLATLWFINDADTVPLIADFYQYWHQGMTKAEALQKAQLKAIADPNGHPAIWSPFILVGDWM